MFLCWRSLAWKHKASVSFQPRGVAGRTRETRGGGVGFASRVGRRTEQTEHSGSSGFLLGRGWECWVWAR